MAWCLFLLLNMKWVRNKQANSLKFSMEPGTKEPNHALAGLLNVNGKALQATSSGNSWNFM